MAVCKTNGLEKEIARLSLKLKLQNSRTHRIGDRSSSPRHAAQCPSTPPLSLTPPYSAFHGHDESQSSNDKGNFLELLQFLGGHNESINEVLQKTPKNCKFTHHDIQKYIVNTTARETSKAIIKDLDNGFFLILVDESCDISMKEQMALVLHYVNNKGIIIEQFLVIDMQLQELNNHFSEANINLLLCMACLNPSDSFVAFDKEKLIRLAKFYPFDFLGTDILALDS
ncbi:uncharacterized protein LOC115971857 [Quercus lobata]|uniref:uncharacterized protein LOC115971857 n=1 Tax=Quercus lobata TaxID=97700 RepID=UPI0012479A9B|nr:uncharacterized protein LOC115971857 [Quercus lobata]